MENEKASTGSAFDSEFDSSFGIGFAFAFVVAVVVVVLDAVCFPFGWSLVWLWVACLPSC